MTWKFKDWEFCRPVLEEGFFPPFMDARHAGMIYKLMMTGRFRNVLEIGSWNGHSTSAFVQAQIDGADFRLTVCDIEIRPLLREVISRAPRPVRILQCKSIEAIDIEYDLILVDGDHRLCVVAPEIECLLKCGTPSILAHDTAVEENPLLPTIKWFDGSRHLAEVFRYHGEYRTLEDKKKRPGEWTERGLFFATRLKNVLDDAAQIWREQADE